MCTKNRILFIILFGLGSIFIPLYWITSVALFGLVGYMSLCIGSVILLRNAIINMRRRTKKNSDTKQKPTLNEDTMH